MCGFYFSWRDLKPSNFYRRLRRARNPAANSANTETPGSGITTPTGTAWKAPATPAATAVPPAAPSAGVPLLTSTLAAKSGASASNVAPVSITKRWAESAIPVPSPPTSQIGLPLKSALPPSPEATPEKKPFKLNAAAPPKSEAAPNYRINRLAFTVPKFFAVFDFDVVLEVPFDLLLPILMPPNF